MAPRQNRKSVKGKGESEKKELELAAETTLNITETIDLSEALGAVPTIGPSDACPVPQQEPTGKKKAKSASKVAAEKGADKTIAAKGGTKKATSAAVAKVKKAALPVPEPVAKTVNVPAAQAGPVISADEAKSPRSLGIKKTRRRSKRKDNTFARYIFKVLKQSHPERGISKKGMEIMKSFMRDIFERISREASTLAHISKRKTLGIADIESAVKLIIPGQLGGIAVNEGARAVAKLQKSYEEQTKLSQ